MGERLSKVNSQGQRSHIDINVIYRDIGDIAVYCQ